MPRRKKATEAATPAPEAASVETPPPSPPSSPSPQQVRRARAEAEVQALLDRFEHHRFSLDYPAVLNQARELLLAALRLEHATCPHCHEDLGPRLPEDEHVGRDLEIQAKLLAMVYQERCTQYTRQEIARAMRPVGVAAARGGEPPAPHILRSSNPQHPPAPVRRLSRADRRRLARTAG